MEGYFGSTIPFLLMRGDELFDDYKFGPPSRYRFRDTKKVITRVQRKRKRKAVRQARIKART